MLPASTRLVHPMIEEGITIDASENFAPHMTAWGQEQLLASS